MFRAAGVAAERPGQLLPLRPMTVADVLDGAFHGWRAVIGAAVLAVLLIRGPVELVSNLVIYRVAPDLLVGTSGFDTTAFDAAPTALDLGAVGLMLLFGVLGSIASVYAAAVTVALVVDADRGRAPQLAVALRSAVRPTGAALVALLLLSMAGFAALIGAVILALIPLLGILVLLFATPIGVGVGAALAVLVVPVAVLERQGPLATLGRALWVLRVRFWRTIGITWLMLIVLLGVSLGISLVLELFAALTGPFAWAVLAVSAVLLSVVQVPVLSLAALLVFLDARMLHEAYDLEVRVTQLAGA